MESTSHLVNLQAIVPVKTTQTRALLRATRNAPQMLPLVVLAALLGLAREASAALPRPCFQSSGSNETAIADCTPLSNDTVLVDETVQPGQYKHFHWTVSNYLDLDDARGDRRSVTFEVQPCNGTTHLFVKALELPWPTRTSHDYASVNDGAPNAVTVRLLRAQYFVSVYGGHSASDGGPARFSITAKISGSESLPCQQVLGCVKGGAAEVDYPVPGAAGTVSVANKFTENLLLPSDTMEMLVTMAPVRSSMDFEYRVYTVSRAV
jgi:hypothetical protein